MSNYNYIGSGGLVISSLYKKKKIHISLISRCFLNVSGNAIVNAQENIVIYVKEKEKTTTLSRICNDTKEEVRGLFLNKTIIPAVQLTKDPRLVPPKKTFKSNKFHRK